MIVTSIPRSGSTKFCMDLAKDLNLEFHDEIFEYEVNAIHKQSIHEINLENISSKSIEFIQGLDFNKCVINNHEINFFSLQQTDLFISRFNVQDSIWSYIAYLDLYLKHFSASSEDRMRMYLGRLLKRTSLFYEYCVVNNKNIVIPELTYKNNISYREQYSEYKDQIDNFGSSLVLPNNLIFA